MKKSIYIGYDPRETNAFKVAVSSIWRRMKEKIPMYSLELDRLRRAGLYHRPTLRVQGALFDCISNHPMATEFAISRFLVPHLAKTGWALFADLDVMACADVNELFALADPTKAVMCVKHNHVPAGTKKMDGQVQSAYPRKNWSSVCLWNCDHPANKFLTVEKVNWLPGRDLHGFCWLEDSEIGALPYEWNLLVGHYNYDPTPKLLHFTDGTPDMKGYETCDFAAGWRAELFASPSSVDHLISPCLDP